MRSIRSPRVARPIALLTTACFLWSLTPPRLARADESAHAPPTEEPVSSSAPEASKPATTHASPIDGAPKPTTPLDPRVAERAAEAVSAAGPASGPGGDPGKGIPLRLPSGADKTGVSSQSISVPQGSGKVGGMGESFSTQLSTGVATFTVPLSLHSARGGADPALSLAYSSAGGHGVAGVGWEIGVPFIARQTDRGLPSYVDPSGGWVPSQDRFVFNGGQELIPICLVGTDCSTLAKSEIFPTTLSGWQYFRPRIEGAFLRFFWSPDHRTWLVQDKGGGGMELGVPLDDSTNANALETDGGMRVFRWNLTRQYDSQTTDKAGVGSHTNVVQYRYQTDGGLAYLSDIYDTPPASTASTPTLPQYAHHVRLRYEKRPDVTTSFRRGWLTSQALRLSGIDVTSKAETGGASGPRGLVRRYALAYDSTYHLSLLKSVQMEGRCGDSTKTPTAESDSGALPDVTGCPKLPPMVFAYSHVDGKTTGGTTAVADLPGYEPFDETLHSLTSSPPYSVDEDLVELYDIDSDALPDILSTAAAYFGGNHGVYFQGHSGSPDTFGAAEGMCVTGIAGETPTTITLNNLNVAAGDLDGDGRVDLLHMPAVKTYSVYSALQGPGTCSPTPIGATGPTVTWRWQGRAVTTATSLSPKIDFGSDAANIRLVDVNSDGLIDVVYSAGTSMQTFFSLGRYPTGDGHFGWAKWTSGTAADIHDEPVSTCVPWSGTPVSLSDPAIKIGDMNGDGLPDLIRVQKGNIQYWPGRGDGHWGTNDPSSCPGGSFGSGGAISMTTSPEYTEPDVSALRLDDVNGDGLDDLVQVRFTDIDIWLNVDGVGWTDRHTISGTPAAPSYGPNVRLVDMNGSGTRDILWGDASKYQYIDLSAGGRPWLLTGVANGLGKTTTIEYASSVSLQLAAAKAGTPWASTMPMPVHVVTKETESDNLDTVSRGVGNYVTTYAYQNPVYDGVQREFRGFRHVEVTRVGDANSPSATTTSDFLLGDCQVEGTGAACTFGDRWKENPAEALKGLPVVSEMRAADGSAVMSTMHHGYTMRRLYSGLDGREVRYVFESQSDSWLYDTSTPLTGVDAADAADVDVLDESKSGLDRAGSAAPRSGSGRAHLRSRSSVDFSGNALTKTESGCVDGCPDGADETITQNTTPALVDGGATGWTWRTVESWIDGSSTGTNRHHTYTDYDVKGNPTATHALLAGSLPLLRSHEDSSAKTAPTPATASPAGPVKIDTGTSQYDIYGNVVFSTGPNGRCRSVVYDTDYDDLPTYETVYAGVSASALKPGCGGQMLTASAVYDRGLSAITEVHDLHAELSKVIYDGFGRLSQLFKPDSISIGYTSPYPSVTVEYRLPDVTGQPYSLIHTSTWDGNDSGVDKDGKPLSSYREAWAYVDGLGRTVVTLDMADPSAGDGGQWVVNGLTEYDAKGAAERAYRAWFWTGSPDGYPLSIAPASKYGRQRYDAFGRVLESYGLDGTRTLYRAYHALGSDAWDAADLSTGAHAGTYASERKDGHGRTIATVERIHAAGGIEERTIATSYLSSGEVSTITRYRAKTPGSDAVVRWMQYDSLGRMVLNVEPNTTKGFVGPGGDVSTLRAWRYVYDNAGDLVGTSDARGCGVNYDYDHAGRLVGEDFSPCLKSQPAYSAPADAVEIGSNYEAYYLYDNDAPDAPSTSSGTLTTLSDGTPFPYRTGLSLGRLVEVIDRGSETLTSYDGRGRVIAVARRVSKPGDIDPTTHFSARYAKSWYVQTADFDGADRPIAESTGAKVPQLQGNDGSSNIYTSYTKRGSVYQVNSSYGMLVSQLIHDADGLPQSITYGDVAATRTDYGYDDRLRLKSVQTYRGPPSVWSASRYKPGYGTGAATTFQLLLEDLQYAYDEVDNPTEIHDFRDPTEWPIGSKPVSRKIAYDDLYRVNRVDYQYAAGTDAWVDPYQPETSLTATDTHLAKPSPHVSFDNRILYESFSYDWLGNSVSTDDDAKGFYDRSLGAVTNGTPTAGPYQLKSASNEGTGGTSRKGHLDAKYDDAGNLTDLAVVRSGRCLPSTSNCTQRFHYDWDEAGRLSRARRWDLGGTPSAADPVPTTTPDADLAHTYDAGDMRVRKSATDSKAATSHTIYYSAALEVRRVEWNPDGNDYRGARDWRSEQPQLIAHGVRLGRVSWEPSGAPSWTIPGSSDARATGQHVFLSLSDHLGSTSTVLDLDTSEVVEKRTSRAYGGVESDQRDPRWEGAKDEKSFTGKEEDEETGLIYFGARYLSIGLGRWVSADPASVQTHEADLNAYAYVHGSAFKRVDPVGLQVPAATKTPDEQYREYEERSAAFDQRRAALVREGHAAIAAAQIQPFGGFYAAAAVGLEYQAKLDALEGQRPRPPAAARENGGGISHGLITGVLLIASAVYVGKGGRAEPKQMLEAARQSAEALEHLAEAAPETESVVPESEGVAVEAENAISAAKSLRIEPYREMVGNTAGQAHHLNQTAAYRESIPRNAGLCIDLRGNILRDAGAPHTKAHLVLEAFWDKYRAIGTRPTNTQYTYALQQSLRAANLSPEQVREGVVAAIRERVEHGLLGGELVPRVPAPIRNIAE